MIYFAGAFQIVASMLRSLQLVGEVVDDEDLSIGSLDSAWITEIPSSAIGSQINVRGPCGAIVAAKARANTIGAGSVSIG